MAEARRRAHEQYGVELRHEVELLGDARAAAARVGAPSPAANLAGWPAGDDPHRHGRPRVRAAAVALPRTKKGSSLSALARFAPSRRSLLVGRRLDRRRRRRLHGRAADVGLRDRSLRRHGRPRRRAAAGAACPRAARRHQPARTRRCRARTPSGGTARRSSPLASTVRFPHTLRIHVVPEVPVAVLHRGKETWLVSARGRVVKRIPNGTYPALARVWVPRKADVAVGAFLRPGRGDGCAHARPRSALPSAHLDRVARARRARSSACARDSSCGSAIRPTSG